MMIIARGRRLARTHLLLHCGIKAQATQSMCFHGTARLGGQGFDPLQDMERGGHEQGQRDNVGAHTAVLCCGLLCFAVHHISK